MKNTIWVFGDSYTQDSSKEQFRELDCTTEDFFTNHPQLHWILNAWPFQLASNLKMHIKNFGVCGSSLEYSAQKYTENFSNFADGDIVIFAVTHLSRKYLIDSKPSWNPYWEKNEEFSQKDIDFYKRAVTENGLRPNETILRLLLHSSIVLKNRNIKVIFIPCFPDAEIRLHNHRELFPGSINDTIGNLNYNISRMEFIDSLRNTALLSGPDKRINHMHKINHDILVNKLTEYIVNNIPLDLANGFEKEIFNDDPKIETNGFPHRHMVGTYVDIKDH